MKPGLFFFQSSHEDMLIDFRERGREGEREGKKHLHEKKTSISYFSYTP